MQEDQPKSLLHRLRWPLGGLLAVIVVGGGVLVADEVKTSRLQAHYLARYAADLNYALVDGRSDAIRTPAHGPFDERMGYSELPQIGTRLAAHGFRLTRQAHFSNALLDYTRRGYFPPYREKTSAGLTVTDCRSETLYRFRYPYRAYADFAAVPPRIAQALTFIENRDLLDEARPLMNPAVDWVRFARAVVGRVGRLVNEDFDAPGGSTLATQIEKFRHSPDGVTPNSSEKLRQMVSASVRAYRDGEQTLPQRRGLLIDYLNTVPLSAAPGFGEVNGLGDGLWVWFAADFNEVNTLLAAPEESGPRLAAQGRALRQVVALMIAHRRPSYYLAPKGRENLGQLSASYIRLFAENGMIGPALRDAALAEPLKFRDMVANPALLPADAGKGATAIRNRLAGLLNVSLYELDRYDADVSTTLDGALQQRVSAYLGRLVEPEFARQQGLIGERMLEAGKLDAVRYSFNLVESTPGSNRVRVQTDTTDQPLDINEGSKLELGSTAKLRVLTTYLEIVAELHQKHAEKTPAELRKLQIDPRDNISRWAIDYLAHASDRSLPAMLQAALARSYSASPGESFFTGGGVHTFNNFRKEDDGRVPTVREALQGSINLPFVRLMRDVVRHAMYQISGSTAQLLQQADDPRRADYLARFADKEGQVFLRRFWLKYRGKKPAEIQDDFLDGLRPGADRLAAVFRYLSPQASQDDLGAFMKQRLEGDKLSAEHLTRLYTRNAPEAYDLTDRAYVARVHPLELWLVGYLSAKPEAGWDELVKASTAERQAVYRWLFRTRFKGAQDSRIFTMLEVEAFLDIHRRWARVGYPFGHLVPSLATALGSSGDRPAALAELMGIIENDGVRLPTRRIDKLDFATGTPYETHFAGNGEQGERVMAPEVAAALRSALSEVVEGGTARRLAGAFKLADGSTLGVGGKTGTGDNRIVLGRGATRGVALNRTATFVFYLGPRHFGTLTAYVIGPDAARYHFTSALPVQILKSMGPLLLPALEPGTEKRCPAPPASAGNMVVATSNAGPASAIDSAPPAKP
ncbi:transglycosylase domain-containing protein [Zoogloea sp. LCSB751]|uniref:transglycosylase domain-containing protein n=1 Tax=Zoogloea sp. LCSB751 TaxID=1965277 RepID=UPI0020B10AD1|nr:transglycosylase domain-containing protein [Zoogloea sp. LCSB751]